MWSAYQNVLDLLFGDFVTSSHEWLTRALSVIGAFFNDDAGALVLLYSPHRIRQEETGSEPWEERGWSCRLCLRILSGIEKRLSAGPLFGADRRRGETGCAESRREQIRAEAARQTARPG